MLVKFLASLLYVQYVHIKSHFDHTCFFQDLALEYNIFAESFETSVAWDRTLSLCHNVKHRLKRECEGTYYCFLVTQLTFSYIFNASTENLVCVVKQSIKIHFFQ